MKVARIEVGSFRRDGVEILRDVEWIIESGQHWAVLGPNGSGKTSLARILGAYEWPSEGAVEVLGDRFGRTDLRELRKKIGLVSSALEPRFPDAEDARSAEIAPSLLRRRRAPLPRSGRSAPPTSRPGHSASFRKANASGS